jgi:hypothetical protein
MNSIVALPIAAAVPTSSPLLASGAPDRRAMYAYASWLFMERRILCREIWPHLGAEAERFDWADNAGYYWHCEGPGSWKDKPQPSSRAAGILDMVGVDWRTPDERQDCGLDHTDTGERPDLPSGWPRVDAELEQASTNIAIMSLALKGLRDDHADCEQIRESWQSSVDLLGEKRSRSWDGIRAKASAIKSLTDEDAIAAIAKSLASDIIVRTKPTRESTTF